MPRFPYASNRIAVIFKHGIKTRIYLIPMIYIIYNPCWSFKPYAFICQVLFILLFDVLFDHLMSMLSLRQISISYLVFDNIPLRSLILLPSTVNALGLVPNPYIRPYDPSAYVNPVILCYLLFFCQIPYSVFGLYILSCYPMLFVFLLPNTV